MWKFIWDFNLQIVSLLIESGVDINLRNIRGQVELKPLVCSHLDHVLGELVEDLLLSYVLPVETGRSQVP